MQTTGHFLVNLATTPNDRADLQFMLTVVTARRSTLILPRRTLMQSSYFSLAFIGESHLMTGIESLTLATVSHVLEEATTLLVVRWEIAVRMHT